MIPRLVMILGLAFPVAACPTIIPQTTALQEVHATYRSEFADCLPQQHPSPEKLDRAQLACSFPKTLAAINDYRNRFPDNQAELNHLTVLEGMIYLQGEQFGLASAIRPDVEKAGVGLTSATGVAARDQLFAENYASILDGWSARAPQTGTVSPEQGLDRAQRLQTAADRIVRNLCAAEADGRLRQASGDQGATYLAMMAAIFTFDSEQTVAGECVDRLGRLCMDESQVRVCIARQVLDVPQTDPTLQQCKNAMATVVTGERMRRARDTVGHFLPERQRTVLACSRTASPAGARGVDCGVGRNWEAARQDMLTSKQSRPLAYYAFFAEQVDKRDARYQRPAVSETPICR